jgi:hypothetical protein
MAAGEAMYKRILTRNPNALARRGCHMLDTPTPCLDQADGAESTEALSVVSLHKGQRIADARCQGSDEMPGFLPSCDERAQIAVE